MAKKKNKDNDVIVSFFGTQADGVTGSNVTISYNTLEGRKHLLVELGGKQGEGTILQEYNQNKKLLDNIPIEGASYCFFIHQHCDHTMHLPALSSYGFQGRTIMTDRCLAITKKLVLDATYIHKRNVEYLKGKGHKNVKLFYTEQDAHAVLDTVETYSVGEIHKLDDYISIRYRKNSHVLGANQLELFIRKPDSKVVKIHITSDLGNKNNLKLQPFLTETDIVTTSNLSIFESTYGLGDRDFTYKDCIDERKELIETISRFIGNNQSVLIPCFSFGRLQSIMCFIYESFKDTWDMNVPIVVDTKLGNEINQVYSRILEGEEKEYWDEVMNWKPFKYIKEYPSTVAFLQSKQNALVLSSSGMISAGHSTMYAKQFLGDSKAAILFCGYCSPSTIGGKILNESQKTVTIDGSLVLKRCYIKRFTTFSSHATQKDLIDYMKQINTNHIVLHHGDEESKKALRDKAIEELRAINKTTKITCAFKDYQISL